MLKSENFVTICLETDECDICHQSTGEKLVTCEKCLQPSTEEPVREGFNELLGVVHQDLQGHEACFIKAHQVLSQSYTNNRKLSTDSVTSQLKGILDMKLQQIIKYARNESNLAVPHPQTGIKSTPCSRTSSPRRSASNTQLEHTTKRKCTSDENLALRPSARQILRNQPAIYDREKCERLSYENKKVDHDSNKLKENKPERLDYEKAKTSQSNKIKDSYLQMTVKEDHRSHLTGCGNDIKNSKTIKIPSDRCVYLPCEHQHASDGWTVDELICEVCGHLHQMNQSDHLILCSSQSESSTDNDMEDLLPVARVATKHSNKEMNKVELLNFQQKFIFYTKEELKALSEEELSVMICKLKSRCKDISSNLVGMLQKRDELKQEASVRHLMIEKLVAIQSTE